MSSPCQASWTNDNGDNTSINPNDLFSFFRTFDEVTAQSQSMAMDQAALTAAETTHRTAQTRLEASAKAVQANTANIQEQTNRIALVSTHWFYGTTIYQPQLWLRGGCAGKIARAQRKLETAQQQAAQLDQGQLQAQAEYQTSQDRLTQCQAMWTQSSRAAERRNQLLDQLVVQHYPSAHLEYLMTDATRHQNTIATLANRTVELEDIGRSFDQVGQQLERSLALASEAEMALHHVQRLEREIATFGSTSASTTNSRGSVPVVHHHHHHHDCRDRNSTRQPGSFHSQRGGHAVVQTHRSHGHSHHCSTNTTIVNDFDMERRNNNFIQMERDQRTATDALHKAQANLKEGSITIERAVEKLIQYIRCHGIVNTKANPPSRLIVLGGATMSSQSIATLTAVEDLRLQVIQLQSLRDEHKATILELENYLRLDRGIAQEALLGTQTQITAEKTRIFDSLRAQTMMHSSSSSSFPVVPSAPNEDSQSYHPPRGRGETIRGAAVAEIPVLMPSDLATDGGPILVAAETPVLIPTERLSSETTGMALTAVVVPTAPPDSMDSGGVSSDGAMRRSVVRADFVK
jgi:hypothetical protein